MRAANVSTAWWLALWFRIALPFLLMIAGSTAIAQPGVVNLGNQPKVDISRELLHVEDPSGTMTFDEVRAPERASTFQPIAQGGNAYNFGFTSSALWFRLTLHASADAPALWYWKVALPTLDHVDLYVSRPDGGFFHQRAGDALAMSEHAVRHKDHVLQVPVVPGGDTTVYMRVQSTGAIALPVTLWEPEALHAHDHVDYALLSLYFGLVLGLLLYNLLLYFSIRDRAYLAYVVFVACMGISQALYTGLAGEFITRDSAQWNSLVLRYVAPFTLLMSVVFTRSFLASRRHMPQVDRVLRVLICAWVVGIVLLTLDCGKSTMCSSC